MAATTWSTPRYLVQGNLFGIIEPVEPQGHTRVSDINDIGLMEEPFADECYRIDSALRKIHGG